MKIVTYRYIIKNMHDETIDDICADEDFTIQKWYLNSGISDIPISEFVMHTYVEYI